MFTHREAAAKKKLQDEAAALAKAHAEAAAKEKAAAEKRKAEEEKVCSGVRRPFSCDGRRNVSVTGRSIATQARKKAEEEAANAPPPSPRQRPRPRAAAGARAAEEAKAKAQGGLVAAVAIKQAEGSRPRSPRRPRKQTQCTAAAAEPPTIIHTGWLARPRPRREKPPRAQAGRFEASTLAELKRKASALEKDAKAAGATIPDLDKPEPKKPAAKKGMRPREVLGQAAAARSASPRPSPRRSPAAEAAGGDDAMDMTAVNKLTDKLKERVC